MYLANRTVTYEILSDLHCELFNGFLIKLRDSFTGNTKLLFSIYYRHIYARGIYIYFRWFWTKTRHLLYIITDLCIIKDCINTITCYYIHFYLYLHISYFLCLCLEGGRQMLASIFNKTNRYGPQKLVLNSKVFR